MNASCKDFNVVRAVQDCMSETERTEKTKTETDEEGNTTTETEVEEKKEDD